MNRLYYGDNLDVLRGCIDNDSVDLVYLDPPFNSQATYNVLFRSTEGQESRAQIKTCKHPRTYLYRWEHDDGYGKQTDHIGTACLFCGAVDPWQRGNFSKRAA